MKIVSLILIKADPTKPLIVSSAFELSNFGYFQRGGVKEVITFFSKTVSGRTPKGDRATVKHEGYVIHVHSKHNGLVALAVCDEEYPARVAFTLLMKASDAFSQQFPEEQWKAVAKDNQIPFPMLEQFIKEYQDPHKADSIMKVQKELDETKVILHSTIESMLERGEKLDNLVERSGDLSAQSKLFYKGAAKENSCCRMM